MFPRLFTEVKFKVRSDYPLPGRVDDGPGKKFKDKSTREDQKKIFGVNDRRNVASKFNVFDCATVIGSSRTHIAEEDVSRVRRCAG